MLSLHACQTTLGCALWVVPPSPPPHAPPPQVWALSVLLPASRELESHQLRNQEEGGGREAAEDGQEADRRGLVRALEGEAGLSSGSGSDSGVGNSSVDIPTGLGWRLAAECDENDEGSSGGSAWGAHWRVQQLDRKRERRRVAEQRSSEGAASEQGVAPGRNAAAGVMDGEDGPMGRQPVPLGTAAAPPPAPSSSQHPHPPPPPPPPWFPPFIEAVLTRQLVGLPPRSLIVVANGLSKMELGLTPQQVIGGRGGRLLGDRAATKRASASHRSR